MTVSVYYPLKKPQRAKKHNYSTPWESFMEHGQNWLRIQNRNQWHRTASGKLKFLSFLMTYPRKNFSARNDSGVLPAFCHDLQNWVSTKSVFANSYFVVTEKCWLVSLKGWWQDSLASEIIRIPKLKMPCVCHMWVVERCSFLLSLQDPYSDQPISLPAWVPLFTYIAAAAGLCLVPLGYWIYHFPFSAAVGHWKY